MATSSSRLKSRSGSGCLSALRPPQTLPMAMAIMMVPMITVHTICDEEKYGASRRLAPSSMAMTDMPEKKLVAYRNTLRPRMGAPCFSMRGKPPLISKTYDSTARRIME